MPEAVEAVVFGGAKVKPRVAFLKPIATAISIGSGGPFGAEGPVIASAVRRVRFSRNFCRSPMQNDRC